MRLVTVVRQREVPSDLKPEVAKCRNGFRKTLRKSGDFQADYTPAAISNAHHQRMSVSVVAPPGFEPVAHSGPAELGERRILGPLEHHPLDHGGCYRSPRERRNEIATNWVKRP